jgi:hypothetical protein
MGFLLVKALPLGPELNVSVTGMGTSEKED